MKIAITGANQGLGLCLANQWQLHGHTVTNFSRSTGYDINNPEEIVNAVKDYDVFINNAYSGFAQVDLLYHLFKAWQGEKKYILNIGTEQTNRWLQHRDSEPILLPWHQQRSFNYRTTKIALNDAHTFLSQQSDWPKMMLVKPAVLDTPRADKVPQNYEERHKTDPEKLAKWLYLAWDQREDFFVSEIAVRPLEWYKQ